MSQVLTCVEGLTDAAGICPEGQGIKLVEGYILPNEPATFDASLYVLGFFKHQFDDVAYLYT